MAPAAVAPVVLLEVVLLRLMWLDQETASTTTPTLTRGRQNLLLGGEGAP